MPGTAAMMVRWCSSAIAVVCARTKELGRNTITACAPSARASRASSAASRLLSALTPATTILLTPTVATVTSTARRFSARDMTKFSPAWPFISTPAMPGRSTQCAVCAA